MYTYAGAALVGTAPYELSVKMIVSNLNEVKLGMVRLLKDYDCVAVVAQAGPCPVKMDGLVTAELRVACKKNTDYLRLCSLRSSLNSHHVT